MTKEQPVAANKIKCGTFFFISNFYVFVFLQKPCVQAQGPKTRSNVKADNTKDKGHLMQNSDGEQRLSKGFSNRGRQSQRQKHQKKKKDGQKDPYQHKEGRRGRFSRGQGRPMSGRGGRGGRGSGHENDMMVSKTLPLMTYAIHHQLVRAAAA